MTIPLFTYRPAAACFLLVFLVLLLLAGGCTQSAPQQQKAPSPVAVSQTDASHLLISYPGSTETTTLLELEVTVTDSAGNAQTRSIGDRFSTTPLKFGATLPLTGSFNGNDHVVVTGYFMDSSKKMILDTTI
jgi:hypothetical protein